MMLACRARDQDRKYYREVNQAHQFLHPIIEKGRLSDRFLMPATYQPRP